jgi:hypothetical protein
MLTLFGVPSLLMPDDQHLNSMEFGETTDDGRIVSEPAVSVYLREILKQERDKVKRVGPVFMARKLDALEGRPGLIRWRVSRRRPLGTLFFLFHHQILIQDGAADQQTDQKLLKAANQAALNHST